MSIMNIDYYILSSHKVKINSEIRQKRKIIERPNSLQFMIGYDLKYKYPYDIYDKYIYHIKFKKNIFRDLYQKRRNNTHILIIDCKRGDVNDLLRLYGVDSKIDWLQLIENYSGIYFKNYNSTINSLNMKWYIDIQFDRGYIWDKISIQNMDNIIDPAVY